jgi:hypothetical protein
MPARLPTKSKREARRLSALGLINYQYRHNTPSHDALNDSSYNSFFPAAAELPAVEEPIFTTSGTDVHMLGHTSSYSSCL